MAICVGCTTNPYLKVWIETNGAPQPCAFCGAADQPAVDTTRLVEHIDAVIRRHYSPDLDDGEAARPLIQRLAGVSADIATRVMNVVREDEELGRTMYDYGPLVFGGRWSHEHSDAWERLKTIVKHEARFFGAETHRILDAILGDLQMFCGGVAVRNLTPPAPVFRARLARAAREADEWFKAPAISLHAPPKEKASAGRMNAAGVRVFYGALRERIAVAEIRPPVGSHVVVGAFTPTRSLRILDLGALGGVFQYADLFSPEFETTSTRLTFLHMLEQEISLPVQPQDELLDYIPTQVIAEYVRIVLGLDGVAYRSAQVGEAPGLGQIIGPQLEPDDRNVVLFGAAAVTEAEPPATGIEPGLRFVPDSQQMLDITKIEVNYQQNMWAHYQDPPDDDAASHAEDSGRRRT